MLASAFIIAWARRPPRPAWLPHPAWPCPSHDFQPWGREAEQQTKLPHPHSLDSESAFQSPAPGFPVTENRGQGMQVRRSPALKELTPPPLFLLFFYSFLFLSFGEVSKLPSNLQSFYHVLFNLWIMSLQPPPHPAVLLLLLLFNFTHSHTCVRVHTHTINFGHFCSYFKKKISKSKEAKMEPKNILQNKLKHLALSQLQDIGSVHMGKEIVPEK